MPTDLVTVKVLLEALEAKVLGDTGLGWRVVVIDEGVDPDSGALKATIVDGVHIVEKPICQIPTEEATPEEGKNQNSKPKTLDHGTMVASIVTWAAPQADYVSFRVGGDGEADVPDVIAALREVSCRWDSELPNRVAVVVLCMSNKNITKESHPTHYKNMQAEVDKLWAKNIAVVVSSGNDGPEYCESFPGRLENVVSVGGVVSSLGAHTFSSNWTKTVDLCAPGRNVGIPTDWYPGIAKGSGTSAAAPFVAGAIVQLREAYPDCPIEVIVKALKSTGTIVRNPNEVLGIPLIQVQKAHDKLRELCALVETPDPPIVPAPPE